MRFLLIFRACFCLVAPISVLVSGLLVSGCSDPAAQAPSVHVGELQGGQVFAASIWDDERVLVYTCGKDATLGDSTSWLTGAPSNEMVTLMDSAVSVSAARNGSEVSGTWNNGTAEETLSLQEVTDRSRAGFFVSIEGDCRTAAVVFDRGGALMFQGAHFCGFASPFFQVTPVRIPSALEDSVLVNFDDGTGLRELQLDRFTAF